MSTAQKITRKQLDEVAGYFRSAYEKYQSAHYRRTSMAKSLAHNKGKQAHLESMRHHHERHHDLSEVDAAQLYKRLGELEEIIATQSAHLDEHVVEEQLARDRCRQYTRWIMDEMRHSDVPEWRRLATSPPRGTGLLGGEVLASFHGRVKTDREAIIVRALLGYVIECHRRAARTYYYAKVPLKRHLSAKALKAVVRYADHHQLSDGKLFAFLRRGDVWENMDTALEWSENLDKVTTSAAEMPRLAQIGQWEVKVCSPWVVSEIGQLCGWSSYLTRQRHGAPIDYKAREKQAIVLALFAKGNPQPEYALIVEGDDDTPQSERSRGALAYTVSTSRGAVSATDLDEDWGKEQFPQLQPVVRELKENRELQRRMLHQAGISRSYEIPVLTEAGDGWLKVRRNEFIKDYITAWSWWPSPQIDARRYTAALLDGEPGAFQLLVQLMRVPNGRGNYAAAERLRSEFVRQVRREIGDGADIDRKRFAGKVRAKLDLMYTLVREQERLAARQQRISQAQHKLISEHVEPLEKDAETLGGWDSLVRCA